MLASNVTIKSLSMGKYFFNISLKKIHVVCLSEMNVYWQYGIESEMDKIEPRHEKTFFLL